MKISKEPEELQLLKDKLISKLISNLHIDQVDKISERFKRNAAKFLRSNLLYSIRQHVDLNHLVYVVTASSELAVNKLLEGYGVEVVGTQFEEKHCRLTGHLIRDGCYGSSKVNEFLLRVKGTHYVDFEIIECWSDSISDWHLMRLAKKRYWVNSAGDESAIRKLDPSGILLRL